MATLPKKHLSDLHLISKMITQVLYGNCAEGLPSIENARSIVTELLGLPGVLVSNPELEDVPGFAMILFDEVRSIPSGRSFLQQYLHTAVNLIREAASDGREVPDQLIADVEFMMECVKSFKAFF